MPEVNETTRKVLGWTLAGVSFFHAAVLLWGAATWSNRLGKALEADYGSLTPYIQEYIGPRGAPIEFLLCLLAALAGLGWILVARHGRAPSFLKQWTGRAALVGGGTAAFVYLAAAVVPLLIIVTPRDVERIPSWDALGASGDATFLVAFLLDAIAVAWWTLERSRQPER